MSGEDGRLLQSREGAVAVLSFDDPAARNAFSVTMRDALIQALVALGDDETCRAIVLTGEGGHFTAGGNLRGFTETTVMAARGRLEQGSATLMRLLIAGRKPVICAVEGLCIGAGVALAAAADYTVVSAGARLRCAFMQVGFIPDLAGLWSLPRRVGLGQAKRIAALGPMLDAEEALRIRLVDEIAPEGQALAAAMKVAAQFAAQPPLALALMKSAFAEGLEEALRREVDLQPILLASADHAEAKAAFFEKRKPEFRGR